MLLEIAPGRPNICYLDDNGTLEERLLSLNGGLVSTEANFVENYGKVHKQDRMVDGGASEDAATHFFTCKFNFLYFMLALNCFKIKT